MGATNVTPNLHLPQWVDTDKPSWLGDVNNAFTLIDNNQGNTAGQIASLQSRCTSLESRVTALEAALKKTQA